MEDLIKVSKSKDSAYTDSLNIAEVFEKQHSHILRDIDNIIRLKVYQDDIKISASKFGLSSYKDKSGKKNRKFNITKDGFALLAMGYTGEKAFGIFLAYINFLFQLKNFTKHEFSSMVVFGS